MADFKLEALRFYVGTYRGRSVSIYWSKREQVKGPPQVQFDIGNDPQGFVSGDTYKQAVKNAKREAVKLIDADRAVM